MDAAYSVYREILIWDNKNRRAQIIKKQKKIIAEVLAVLTVLTVTITIMCMTITPKACEETPSMKYYTTRTVGVSESLYNLAQEYMTAEYGDVDEYINEVCQINRIEDASSIQTGEMIILPYYASEFKN